MSSTFSPGDTLEFSFTNSIQTEDLMPGRYKLEVWGAQGANRSNTGGLGGYSSGEIDIFFPTTLYICIGGQGSGTRGGYNGGGNTGGAAGGGGGATHIAKEYGLLSSLYNYKDDGETILIVAGGGGGAQAGYGGTGGGITGGTGQDRCGTPGYGGSQTAGGTGGGYTGSFGQGGNGTTGSDGNYGGAGGGGWYGGGGGSSDYSVVDDSGGGGGSGFIGNVENGITNNGIRSGNGYAKITCIDLYSSEFSSFEEYLNSLPVEISTIGSKKDFTLKKRSERIILGPGKYKLECWGAKGGDDNYIGGLGGYSSGVLTLIDPRTIVYINVGGQGITGAQNVNGGYNGGGNASTNNSYASGGGGGASDIRIGRNNLYARVIVAGGGGGAGYNQGDGAPGGGQIGGPNHQGNSATQTSGYMFGVGQDYAGDGSGGGGGWYGGYATVTANYIAGGGSGYVYDASSAKNYPSGCLLNSKYYLQYGKNIRGDHTFYAPGGNLENGHSGDGYVRITNIGDNFQVEFYYTETLEPINLVPGRYKFEAYGALGGMYSSGYERQQGGYTSGIVLIKRPTTVYVACGRRGMDYSTNQSYGMQFNGGGEGYGGGGDGGGATDFRLINGAWNNTESLKSRIFVSGGAGGSDLNSRGGIGGGLIGESCYAPQSGSVATGGTQTSGGVQPSNTAVNGRFGMGGGATYSSGNDAGGGGGGYYGGAAGTGGHAAGAGGSSFAAGWDGCDTTYSYYHNRLKFTNVVMQQGGGIGDGVARITLIQYLPQTMYTLTINKHKGVNNVTSNQLVFNDSQTVDYIEIGEDVEFNANMLPGYTFDCFTGYMYSVKIGVKFTMPAQDISFYAHAHPNQDTKYVVRHQKMNTDGSTYTLFEIENLQGTTDTSVTPDTKTYNGFTPPSTQTVNINGDGSRVVTYNYTRNKYTLTLTKDVGFSSTSTTPLEVFHGASVDVSATLKPGYTFAKWDGYDEQTSISFTFIMPIADITYKANSFPNPDTKYTVRHQKMNLDGSTYKLFETDILEGTTDTSVTPETKNYIGFTPPSKQTVNIDGDGSRVVTYNYTRNKYNVTVKDGISSKSQYFFEEDAYIEYNAKENPLKVFSRWYSESKDVMLQQLMTKETLFAMPAHDVYIYAIYIDNRKNSNIYKNIFETIIFDIYNMQNPGVPYNNVITFTQFYNKLDLYDLVYIDQYGLYKKALATQEDDKYQVVGIITRVIDKNTYELMSSGVIDDVEELISADDFILEDSDGNILCSTIIDQHFEETGSSIIYLSDKNPGGMTIYEDIENKFYKPIGFYNNGKIIINIIDASIGDTMKQYQPDTIFTGDLARLTQDDINNIVQEVYNHDSTA